eukprot:GILI01014766.1.p1 GENE.GILI01014766.1~~GILI01014766.1.p1  ORF type:complete len:936 (+),score=248.86 GILI01014766.1:335-2809(+)
MEGKKAAFTRQLGSNKEKEKDKETAGRNGQKTSSTSSSTAASSVLLKPPTVQKADIVEPTDGPKLPIRAGKKLTIQRNSRRSSVDSNAVAAAPSSTAASATSATQSTATTVAATNDSAGATLAVPTSPTNKFRGSRKRTMTRSTSRVMFLEAGQEVDPRKRELAKKREEETKVLAETLEELEAAGVPKSTVPLVSVLKKVASSRASIDNKTANSISLSTGLRMLRDGFNYDENEVKSPKLPPARLARSGTLSRPAALVTVSSRRGSVLDSDSNSPNVSVPSSPAPLPPPAIVTAPVHSLTHSSSQGHHALTHSSSQGPPSLMRSTSLKRRALNAEPASPTTPGALAAREASLNFGGNKARAQRLTRATSVGKKELKRTDTIGRLDVDAGRLQKLLGTGSNLSPEILAMLADDGPEEVAAPAAGRARRGSMSSSKGNSSAMGSPVLGRAILGNFEGDSVPAPYDSPLSPKTPLRSVQPNIYITFTPSLTSGVGAGAVASPKASAAPVTLSKPQNSDPLGSTTSESPSDKFKSLLASGFFMQFIRRRLVLAACCVFAGSLVHFGLAVDNITSELSSVNNMVAYAAYRSVLTHRVHFLVTDLTIQTYVAALPSPASSPVYSYKPYISQPTVDLASLRSTVLSQLDELKYIHFKLVYGSPSLQLPDSASRPSEQTDLLYKPLCQSVPGIPCDVVSSSSIASPVARQMLQSGLMGGLRTLFDQYVDSVNDFTNAEQSSLLSNDTRFIFISAAFPYLDLALNKSEQISCDYAISVRDTHVQTQGIVIGAQALTFIFIFVLLLKPIILSLSEENQRIRLMLSMIPSDIFTD